MRDDLPPESDTSAWLRAKARTWRPRLRFAGARRDDPGAWREDFRGELARLLRLPGVEPAAPRIAWQAPTRPHSLTLLEAPDPHGLVGRAWLAAPAALEHPAPAVLVAPDARGGEVVVGQAGREGDRFHDLAAEIAAMGLVALVMSPTEDPAALDGLLATGLPLLGLRAAAGLAWLKYLRLRPDVAAGHVGLLGLGEGSRVATLLAGLDDVPALALCGGWEPWMPALQAGEPLPEARTLPGLLELADWPELLLLAWTGGLHLEAPAGRRGAAEVKDMARLLGEVRDLLGHGEAARIVQAESGEDLPTPGLRVFLEQWLLIPSRAS